MKTQMLSTLSWSSVPRSIATMAAISFVLSGCTPSIDAGPSPTQGSGSTPFSDSAVTTANLTNSPSPLATPSPAPNPSPSPSPAPTPTPIPRVGDHLVLVVGDLQSAVVGTPVSIQPKAQLIDNFGDPMSGIDLVFTVVGGAGQVGSGSSSQVVTTDSQGYASTLWTLGTTAGANSVSVAPLIGSLSGSPSSISFTASGTAGAVAATYSSIVGTGPAVANGVSAATVTITLKDVNNNAVAGVTPTFSATDTGSGNSYGACSASNSTGESTCNLKSTRAETKTLSLTGPISLSGGTVAFSPGPGTAAQSTVSVSPTSVAADGTSTATITVTLKDAYNNLVSGKVVSVASSRGATDTIDAVSATSGPNGQASFTVKSSTGGSATLTATDSTDSVTLNQTSTITFMAAPASLAASASGNSVSLTWNTVSGATSYNVKRSTTSGSGYVVVSTPGSVTSGVYTDSNVASRTTYYYVVSAATSAVESGNSGEASVTTPLLPPTNLIATPSSTSIALTWDTVSGATSYNVKRSITQGSGYVTVSPAGTVTTGNFNDTGLTNTTTYYYVVTAVDGSGESVASSEVFGTPLALPANGTIRFQTVGTGVIDLRLQSGATGATGYTVFRSLSSTGTFDAVGTTSTLTYSDTTVTNGTAYFYKMQAINSSTNGGSSLTSATPALTPIDIPTGLSSTGVTPSSVSFTWSPVTGATGYSIKRSTTSGSGYTQVGTSATPPFTDVTAPPTSTLYYVVAATNAKGSSLASSEVSATTTGLVAPTGVLVTNAFGGAVDVSWNAVSGATSYTVSRSTTSGSGFSTLGTSTSANYTDSTTSGGTVYYYTVSATANGITTANSSEVSIVALTQPVVSGVSSGNTQATLNWTAMAGATSYNVKRSTTSGSGYATIHSVTSGTNYVDNGLTQGTFYYYVVTAVALSSESANSSESVIIPGTPMTVSSVGPNSGVLLGGETLTISGTGFQSGLTATLDGITCASPTFLSSTSMTCVTQYVPSTRVVHVAVTNPSGQNATLLSGFTYTLPRQMKQISSVYGHSCAVVGGAAQCWGQNSNGNLGNGGTAGQFSPVPVSGMTSGVQAIATGVNSTCAIKNNALYCWGGAYLGDGTSSGSLVPVAISGFGTGVTAVALATSFGCAIKDGGAYCWGTNVDGQLGNGTTNLALSPVPVTGLGSGVEALSTGWSHACAIKNGGTYCWGTGYIDGHSASGTFKTPVAVSGLSSGTQGIYVGSDATCAILNGVLKCWGDNTWGQLGVGSGTSSSATLMNVSGIDIANGLQGVSAGSSAFCAILSGGLKCWGSNSAGEVGNGTFIPTVYTPVAVSGLGPSGSGVQEVTTGGATCAVVNGGVQCWGSNFYGGLGDGTTTNSSTPVQVNTLTSGVVTSP